MSEFVYNAKYNTLTVMAQHDMLLEWVNFSGENFPGSTSVMSLKEATPDWSCASSLAFYTMTIILYLYHLRYALH